MHMSTIFFMTVAHLFSKRETPLPLSQVVGGGRGGGYQLWAFSRCACPALLARFALAFARLKNVKK